MYDPNQKLSEMLGEQDSEFRELQQQLETLKQQFRAAAPSERQRILKRMSNVREQVDARISYARSS